VAQFTTDTEKVSEIATERVLTTTEDVSENIKQITVTAAPQVVRDLKKKHEEVTTEDHTGEINADGYGWVQLQYSAEYHIRDNHLTRSNGVVYFMGHRETWYSTNEASGKATAWEIPGKHVADDGTIRVDIDYMDRKSALVVELESAQKIENVQVRGIIKDGRLLETSFEWDDRLHCPCFNMLVYIFLPALAILAILRTLHGIGTPCGALWTYGIGMAGLPLGIYLYFRKHRRIFSKRFYEVKGYIGG
jgi:hypothetical protein